MVFHPKFPEIPGAGKLLTVKELVFPSDRRWMVNGQ